MPILARMVCVYVCIIGKEKTYHLLPIQDTNKTRRNVLVHKLRVEGSALRDPGSEGIIRITSVSLSS